MHLYIHIPFCFKRCFYCSFKTLVYKDQEKAYEKALFTDLKALDLKGGLKTVFIGGGTPSILSLAFYEKLFLYLRPFLSRTYEFSMEANPSSSDFEYFKALKALGLNRLSFGVQSFSDEKLKFLGRSHDAKEAIKCLDDARKAGFLNINVDLIYDCLGDDLKLLKRDLNLAKNCSHISAYALTLEPRTPFYKHKNYALNDPLLARKFKALLEDAGFKSYEVSNFGKPCLHNLAYWQYEPYFAAGFGAVGFDGKRRFYSTKSLSEYLKDPCFKQSEELLEKDIVLEKLFLGFRSMVGVKADILDKNQLLKARFLQSEGKLICSLEADFKAWFLKVYGRENACFLPKKESFFARDMFLADELALFIA